MISSRFYRPKIAGMVRNEKDFLDVAEKGKMLYFIPDAEDPIMTRRIAIKDEKNQVTYSFSSSPRNNIFINKDGKVVKYGIDGISFRLLYEFLCQEFNSGEYFIDTYFKEVFPTRNIYDRFDALNDTIRDNIEAEEAEMLGDVRMKADGTPDMRYTISKIFMNFRIWKNPIIRQECSEVADEIQKDIIVCLSNSIIPLRRKYVAESTEKIREKIATPPITGKEFFYASGQLIRSLSIFVEARI